MKYKFNLGGIALVIIALYIFVAAPNLNPLYAEGAFFWLVVLSIYTVIFVILPKKVSNLTMIDSKILIKGIMNRKSAKLIVGGVFVLWIVYFVVNVLFTPLFFYKDYRDQMETPIEQSFTSDIQPIDINQIPIVDKSLAKTLADRKLGESPSLGSQVTLGEPTIQNVAGELVWVVPLHHSGIFKWLANLEGSAGYIKVSATNLKNIEYVPDYKIKIQPESYLLDDLHRYARLSAGLFTGITDYSFEIDDEGNPYWVLTTYKNSLGFVLPEATGVILVNAQNGDHERYSLDEVPEWVDRVQPEDFIINQIDNKGEYSHGVFNFSNKDKFRTTPGHAIVYFDNRCYLFTGMTSVGIDESATGFIMVDMVTKEPTIYRISGATEMSAQDSAQGKVQDLGYRATFPIVLNVGEQPTYFMTLKDSAGLIKKYAFVSIKDYMVVGVGDTVTAAKNDYMKSLSNIGGNVDFDKENEAKSLEKTGTINRINWNVMEGITVYTFTTVEEPTILYTGTVSISDQLIITKPGDKVKFSYLESELNNKNITLFENMTYGDIAVTEE